MKEGVMRQIIYAMGGIVDARLEPGVYDCTLRVSGDKDKMRVILTPVQGAEFPGDGDVKSLQFMKSLIDEEISAQQDLCIHEMEDPDSGVAHCIKCGWQPDGWYCPKSPDLECDYNQENGLYDEDCCRYCDQPKERK